jgi:hypothetical protein
MSGLIAESGLRRDIVCDHPQPQTSVICLFRRVLIGRLIA